nr:DinB family protein [uncultured Holophaga sp.]
MKPITLPTEGTFAPHHAPYLARIPENRWQEFLESQPSTLAGLLRGKKGEHRYAPGKWSLKELVSHINDTERIHSTRLLCIARGDTQSLPGFDQDGYANLAGCGQRSLEDLVREFGIIRQATLALLEGLPPEALDRIGTANGVSIGVRALAYLIPGHAEHHFAVIRDRY